MSYAGLFGSWRIWREDHCPFAERPHIGGMPLIDAYGRFSQSNVECQACGWTGLGFEMPTGDTCGDGCEKDCPACGEHWGFVQWSIAVADDAPADGRAHIERVAD
jgi:hypothetical protein